MLDIFLWGIAYILLAYLAFSVAKLLFWDLPIFLYQVFYTPYPTDPDNDDQNRNIKSDFIDYM